MNSPRRAFTDAEHRRIHAVLASAPSWERALFQTYSHSGLRLSEVCALNVGAALWHDRITNKLAVPPRWQKGHYGATRWLPMAPAWRSALNDYLKERRALADNQRLCSKDPLFWRPLKRAPQVWVPVTSSYVRAQLNNLLDRARVYRDRVHLSSHSWRKTYAQHMLAASRGDIFVVQKALGHSRPWITEAYACASPQAVIRAIYLADWTRRPRAKGKT